MNQVIFITFAHDIIGCKLIPNSCVASGFGGNYSTCQQPFLRIEFHNCPSIIFNIRKILQNNILYKLLYHVSYLEVWLKCTNLIKKEYIITGRSSYLRPKNNWQHSKRIYIGNECTVMSVQPIWTSVLLSTIDESDSNSAMTFTIHLLSWFLPIVVQGI